MFFNLSFSLIFKLISLFIFTLLFIYLLYIEYNYRNKKILFTEGNLLESSNRIPKIYKDIFLVLLPAGISYRTFFRDEINQKKFEERLATATKEAELSKAITEKVSLQAKILSKVREDKLACDSIKSQLDAKVSDLTTAAADLDAKEPTKSLILTELAELKKQQALAADKAMTVESELLKQIDTLSKIVESDEVKVEVKKSFFLNFDFDLQKFLDTLSKEELLAFSGLLLNSLVLSYVISIILIIYGDYLINRFELEIKYPKLAKFIQIRRKLQNYYLKLCFIWIFIGILPQFYVYLHIIYPKLISLIFA